ncbi:MAG: DNA cytosine methyltransferase [Paracoccaceae bacterium]
MNKQPQYIDLFAGCGGLSLGLKRAGWQGVFAIEKSEDAFNTLKHNLIDRDVAGKFDWPEWLPCEAHTTSNLIANYGGKLGKLRGKIDLIAGGPPCQGFSFAGKRNPNDPRNKLTDEYIELVNIVRPKFLLLENVGGFKAGFRGSDEPPYSEVVKQTLSELPWGGYEVFSSMVNASKFGVPQPRARFIMVAVRSDLAAKIEVDPFNEFDDFCQGFRDQMLLNGHEISVREAIADLEIGRRKLIESVDSKGFRQINYREPKKMSAFQALMRKDVSSSYKPNSLRMAKHRESTIVKFIEVLTTCPKGKALSKENRERFNSKKQCLTPLHPDQMSKTITTLPDDLIHYSEPRILTVRENARIQSFPDWFEFQGKYTTGGSRRKLECPRYTQVGNAVPPLMAEALGQKIMQLFEAL